MIVYAAITGGNIMTKIGELISNISKYGNSKLYMHSYVQKPGVNNVLEFSVDENGNLNVVGKIEIFDRQYWDNYVLNSSAKLIKSIESYRFSQQDLVMNMSVIILSTLCYNKLPMVPEQEVPTNVNTDKAVNVIYQIANSMLQLSDKDLANIVCDDDNSVENMLIKKASECVISDEIKPTSVLIENIERQAKDVITRLTSVKNIWKEMNNSQTKDEYKKASKKWEKLFIEESDKISSRKA